MTALWVIWQVYVGHPDHPDGSRNPQSTYATENEAECRKQAEFLTAMAQAPALPGQVKPPAFYHFVCEKKE
jgi:hypothetical protein